MASGGMPGTTKLQFMITGVAHIPVELFAWGEPHELHELTCRNHPKALYYSKNPWQRGLHFIKGNDLMRPYDECPCPFSDLVVVQRPTAIGPTEA